MTNGPCLSTQTLWGQPRVSEEPPVLGDGALPDTRSGEWGGGLLCPRGARTAPGGRVQLQSGGSGPCAPGPLACTWGGHRPYSPPRGRGCGRGPRDGDGRWGPAARLSPDLPAGASCQQVQVLRGFSCCPACRSYHSSAPDCSGRRRTLWREGRFPLPSGGHGVIWPVLLVECPSVLQFRCLLSGLSLQRPQLRPWAIQNACHFLKLLTSRGLGRGKRALIL